MTAGDGEDLQFALGPVELALTVSVDNEAKPDAKVQFWVVELGAETNLGSNSTQKIKLTLDPHRAGRPGVRPDISGVQEPGEQ